MTYITTTTCRSSAAAANTRVTQARHFEQQPIKFLHLALVFRFIMTRAEQVSAKQDKASITKFLATTQRIFLPKNLASVHRTSQGLQGPCLGFWFVHVIKIWCAHMIHTNTQPVFLSPPGPQGLQVGLLIVGAAPHYILALIPVVGMGRDPLCILCASR